MSNIKYKGLVKDIIGKKFGKQEVLGFGETIVRPTTGKPVWTIKVKCTHPDGHWHIYERPGSTFMRGVVEKGDKYEALCRELNVWNAAEREYTKSLSRHPNADFEDIGVAEYLAMTRWAFLYKPWKLGERICQD